MLWLFAPAICSHEYQIMGEDAVHISKSLRMRAGEELTICTSDCMQHLCRITDITQRAVTVDVIASKPCEQEPTIEVTLYQALTKNDKMDLIIQKAVELGVHRIVPVISARCISRPDSKSAEKKSERWNKISRQAAMQSRRAIVPFVCDPCSFEEAARQCSLYDSALIYYELGGEKTGSYINNNTKRVAIFVGSEGGFEADEVDMIVKNGGHIATLGKRILRAETAPLAALSVIMYSTGNLE